MGKPQRAAYGEALLELGARDERVVVLDADLAHATMTQTFRERYPGRFYNFGIAEANLICAAAGMAHAGLLPFASTFSLFGCGRAYEPIRNAIAYPKANVKLAFTHHGLNVGEDGGSHQAVEDLALMRAVPNMTILSPCDAAEAKKAVLAAAEIDGPVYIRLARIPGDDLTDEGAPFVPGRAVTMREGADVCIMATGLMVQTALAAAALLEREGVSAAVVNHHTIKPIDRACIRAAGETFRAIVTVEEHSVIGGLGSAVAEALAGKSRARFGMVGIQDVFGRSGKPADLYEAFGLTPGAVAGACRALL